MVLYTVRSERLFCEQLGYNLLFRWFVDLRLDEPSFDHSTFSRKRARLMEHRVALEFFVQEVAQARGARLLSDHHFTVDGTLIDAWASLKSFARNAAGAAEPSDDPGNPTVNFHGEPLQCYPSVEHGSRARLYRKAPAKKPNSATCASFARQVIRPSPPLRLGTLLRGMSARMLPTGALYGCAALI